VVALRLASTTRTCNNVIVVISTCDLHCCCFCCAYTGGTDNHLILVDLKPNSIDGARVQTVLDLVSITLNKNSVPGDKSAMVPGGMRIGTPALTTRGFKEAEFVQVAEFIDRAVKIASDCQAKTSAPGGLQGCRCDVKC
jgi:glycine hydroxymethyltransferase